MSATSIQGTALAGIFWAKRGDVTMPGDQHRIFGVLCVAPPEVIFPDGPPKPKKAKPLTASDFTAALHGSRGSAKVRPLPDPKK